MTDAPEQTKRPVPPYLPYRTFSGYLDSLRTFVPSEIDRSSMRSYSGAIQSWLLSALRYLNMIDDDGRPKPRLEQIAQATDDERKPMLRQLIEAEYAFLKGIDLTRATPRQIDDAFEQAGASGDTVRKCVVFFIALAKDAGLPLSPLLGKRQRRQRQVSTRRNAGNGTTPAPQGTPSVLPSPPVERKSHEQILIEMLDPNSMDDAEQTAIWTLLKYLKKKSAA